MPCPRWFWYTGSVLVWLVLAAAELDSPHGPKSWFWYTGSVLVWLVLAAVELDSPHGPKLMVPDVLAAHMMETAAG